MDETSHSNLFNFRFTPEQRDCYTHDEVNLNALPLEKGYRMSMKNCLYDEALHAAISKCKCKPSFYVQGVVGKKLPICIGKQLDCAYDVFDNVESPCIEKDASHAEGEVATTNKSSSVNDVRNMGKRMCYEHVGTAGGKCKQPCNDQIYTSRYV